jgi:hypothetical protein
MLASKKAQASIDIIIVIIFLLLFLYVYNMLADNTVRTLEINKINEQEKQIAFSINNFLILQDSILGDVSSNNNIVDYNSSFNIPYINIPSKQQGCIIAFSTNELKVSANYNSKDYNYVLSTNLPFNKFEFPNNFINCGDVLNCTKSDYKLECK